ncbi:M15 family metallopeptidase [Anaeropeptidivorans aminofermentans]|uniref:M15 family metallopeptidase n=1 Tax=Anaeropeptidivorans aminofermentans TaxID=2934315 RepID=UPI0020255CA6|nr:M15 family metallopeptidase [Anaeropeptidivorans aminofermentans]
MNKENKFKLPRAFAFIAVFIFMAETAYGKDFKIEGLETALWLQKEPFWDIDYIKEEKDSSQEDRSFYLTLVNRENVLDKSFGPEKTMVISDYIKHTKSPIVIEEEAGQKLILMFDAMKEDGFKNIAVVSGYRSYEYQEDLHKKQVKKHKKYPKDEAIRRASKIVAPAGCSEHQTGLAVDVSTSAVGYELNEAFEETEDYRWLRENSYKFGYIVRYTKEKRHITGVIYEPWHLRYVGEEAAKEIVEKSLCFEEYCEMLNGKDLIPNNQ